MINFLQVNSTTRFNPQQIKNNKNFNKNQLWMDGNTRKRKKKTEKQKQHTTNIDFVQQRNAELYLLVVGQKKSSSGTIQPS